MQEAAMTQSEIDYASAAELALMIRTKQVSASEVVRAALARAELVQAACNCFITIGERGCARGAGAG
jgi:Asp-tRNA(Asn)/Glu-tRNA(Gln) amidotransferase A subunit family amidase